MRPYPCSRHRSVKGRILLRGLCRLHLLSFDRFPFSKGGRPAMRRCLSCRSARAGCSKSVSRQVIDKMKGIDGSKAPHVVCLNMVPGWASETGASVGGGKLFEPEPRLFVLLVGSGSHIGSIAQRHTANKLPTPHDFTATRGSLQAADWLAHKSTSNRGTTLRRLRCLVILSLCFA